MLWKNQTRKRLHLEMRNKQDITVNKMSSLRDRPRNTVKVM